MPPQPAHGPGTVGDQVLTVIQQQADLHGPLVQIGDRELLDPVLDDRPGDRQRVDLIGLARLALALAGGAHALRRNPEHSLTGGHQSLLETVRHQAAVLDRPHAIVAQAARPADRGQMPRPVRSDLAAAAHPARSLIHRRKRVRPLVPVRPNHDHMTLPSFG